jgi:hypothetical protein
MTEQLGSDMGVDFPDERNPEKPRVPQADGMKP